MVPFMGCYTAFAKLMATAASVALFLICIARYVCSEQQLYACCAEPGPLSPQASARPPLARDSSQQIPRVSSTERLQTGTPGKAKAQTQAQPMQLKPGHKVPSASTLCSSPASD